jgi:hypothetical protein
VKVSRSGMWPLEHLAENLKRAAGSAQGFATNAGRYGKTWHTKGHGHA